MKKTRKLKLISMALGILFCVGGTGLAAEKSDPLFTFKPDKEIRLENEGMANPFGLVYNNAITENKDGAVNIHPIAYYRDGIKIAANVYTPADWTPDTTKKYAAICVAHPNGGVKEQVAGLFAQRMAEKGYITIAADASYQGASGGEPRLIDSPANRIADISRMADIISQFSGVDSERIGILGICGGGGYTLGAVQTDKRFKAVATLSMFNSGQVRREGYGENTHKSVSEINAALREAAAARDKEVATGEVTYTPNMLTALTPEQAQQLPFALYRDGYDYYGVSHKHPNSTFSYTASSLIDLARYDVRDRMGLIDQPLLMMAGSAADSLYMTDEAFSLATGTTQKEEYLVPGARHIETYYVASYVEQEVAKLAEFMEKYL